MTNSPSNSTPDKALVKLRREVSRKLGASLIRLQQYEMLMKAMLAARTVEGTVEQIEGNRAKKLIDVQSKTLGMLVKEFCDEFVVSEQSAKDHEVEDSKALNPSVEAPWFRHRFTMEMSSEDHKRLTAALIELKGLRNQLVHHFLERFPLVDESSCQAAGTYLDTSYPTINDHYLRLLEWAKSMDNARTLSASFVQTQMYEDFVYNWINPDGSVEWPASGIVHALREAEAACAKDGWTLLDSAIAWLRADHSDQTPAKYQCKTWRQVLERSKQFETRTAVDPVNNRGKTWFRSIAVV